VETDAVQRQRYIQRQRVAAAGADVAGGVEDVVVGDHEHAVDHVADAVVRPARGEGGVVPELVFPGDGAAPCAVGFELRVAGADAVGFQRGGGDEILEVELADFARERQPQLVVGVDIPLHRHARLGVGAETGLRRALGPSTSSLPKAVAIPGHSPRAACGLRSEPASDLIRGAEHGVGRERIH
jgi:hypothetical protein